MTWTVTETAFLQVGGRTVTARRLNGHADNSAFPGIDVNLQMVLVTPVDARRAVPVMILFGRAAMPGEPAKEQYRQRRASAHCPRRGSKRLTSPRRREEA